MNINPFNEYGYLNVNFDFVQKAEDRTVSRFHFPVKRNQGLQISTISTGATNHSD